jgi:pSer/pThr/pTyr-binding forkhead associated (FHA) protein
MANARFRAINTELSGTEYPLPDHPAILGRSSSCDLCVRDQSISRQHVRIQLENGTCRLTDLGSQNGILFDGKELREIVLENGERFELGDVAFEFVCDMPKEPPAPSAPLATQSAPPPEDGAFPMQQAGAALPGERPVLLDDLFGPGPEPEPGHGPGAEEQAAVAGARGALKYTALMVLILAVGVLMWNLAGGDLPDSDIKPVIVRVGETKVIDLGIRVRKEGRAMVPYIDHREYYDNARVLNDNIASFELDDIGFMATVIGHETGYTDVKLFSRTGQTATVRILVRGIVERDRIDPHLTPAECLSRANTMLEKGKAALKNRKWHLAMEQCSLAYDYAQRAPSAAATRIQQEADQIRGQARSLLNEAFGSIKAEARAAYRDNDRRAAARAWEDLIRLVPDPNDEMHQKLTIIFNRTVDQLRRGG